MSSENGQSMIVLHIGGVAGLGGFDLIYYYYYFFFNLMLMLSLTITR